MSEFRVAARTLGPGEPGVLRVLLTLEGKGPPASLLHVPVDRLPPELRMPNATFVAVMSRRQLVRVEPLGPAWLTYQDRMREVLDGEWDPIGCARGWAGIRGWSGECDLYIDGIHRLLEEGASDDLVARHLRRIETKSMSLSGTDLDKLLGVAARLRAIRRPGAGG